MEKASPAVLAILLLPLVLGVSPSWKILKDLTLCQEKDTACKMSSGDYGCCAAADGVCCADGEHCCPSGFECDLSTKQCVQYGDPALYVLTEKMLDVVPMGARNVREVTKGAMKAFDMDNSIMNTVCPNGMSQCPENATCCETKDHMYGCCPGSKAVCCAEMYCCPEGYECNAAKGTCVKNNLEIMATSMDKVKEVKVMCPDGQSECPKDQTCCLTQGGAYGCCPVPNAVCCSDHVHCCPSGYTCDVAEGSCIKSSLSPPAITPQAPARVHCPDGGECADGQTCCMVDTNGTYGCCPEPNAVCCSDLKTCCPEGYQCNVESGTCTKGSTVAKFSLIEDVEEVRSSYCPDEVHYCPTTETCCDDYAGGYGCCPEYDGVCCIDGEHCCPFGYYCDNFDDTCVKYKDCDKESSTCVNGTIKKTIDPIKHVNYVVCPNGHMCQDSETCCMTQSGDYGCCPQPNAVCCSDHIHCCPSGYTCDVTEGMCLKSSMEVGLTELMNSHEHVKEVTCPNDQRSCPDNNTCCLMQSGQFGCCPMPDAVCCSDYTHCCPNGYTCNTAEGTCLKSSQLDCDKAASNCPNIKADFTKLEESREHVKHIESVECPNGSTCPNLNTCCPTGEGGYGCCPLYDANCCSDQIHCCPTGYTCNFSDNTCVKSSPDVFDRIPFLTKSPATRRL